MNSLRFAQVTKIHPAHHTVDIVFIDDARPESGVPVITMGGSYATGISDLPIPGATVSGDTTRLERSTRDVFAVVAYMMDRPVVLGFVLPEVCQILFDRAGLRVQRHGSDVYSTVDDAGNIEFRHPSGTYLRIAETPEHEDLTGKDFDGHWKIERNLTKAVHAHLEVHNAGVKKATVDIDPAGNITVDTRGALTMRADGAINLSTNTSLTITTPSFDLNSA